MRGTKISYELTGGDKSQSCLKGRGSKFPDLRKGHLSALALTKGKTNEGQTPSDNEMITDRMVL